MGATYWEHLIPFESTAEAALQSLQAEVIRRSGYDLGRLLKDRITSMEQAVRWCEEDDPYNLLEHYQECLRQFHRLASEGVPDDITTQVALLREIEAISSDSAPGVLEIEGVSGEPGCRRVHCLSAELLESAFGTATPDLLEARAGLARLADSIDRGSAICFAVYEGGRPISWCFAGLTTD